ncbi:DUF899 domain-containing protein [Nocardia testacea]|uniref:DUF899 domain-containing protein n=1 Tax=Nocardia testacea TaxID=248551 RepID=UPI003A83B51F
MMPGNLPRVVRRDEWLAARKRLLEAEKELTLAQDRLNADRRRLPMVRVDKPYEFEGSGGKVCLLDLFEGRSQLVMHHLMWMYHVDADGVEQPGDTTCPNCAGIADSVGKIRQLHARNTTLVAVARAPYDKIAPFRDRMGWTFPWYSSYGTDFNYDFHATVDDRVAPVLLNFRTEAELAEAGQPWNGELRGEWPGISAFLRVGDDVYHTYSTFGRGFESFFNGYNYLDLTALGRQEDWEEPQERATPLGMQAAGPGVRFPDEYESR